MSAPLRPDDYRPHLHSEFRCPLADGRVRPFVLDAVHTRIDDEVQLCFSVQFRSPGETLDQALYALDHDVLGRIELFLVPTRPNRQGVVYEAVFNLLREAAQ